MSDSETDGYVNYSIHSKDIQTARKEIEQFEKRDDTIIIIFFVNLRLH